jgi:DNA-binding transcriptional MerR regulator
MARPSGRILIVRADCLPKVVAVATEAVPLTIDELARQAGMTVRNVRAYRSRGLIPPPELRGRKGYYGAEHLARLEQVRDLKEKGFNLQAIAQILGRDPDESLREVLDFTRAVMQAGGGEEPQVVSTRVFVERWGEQLTPAVVKRAERLGFVRRVGDDQWEIRSPRLDEAAQTLAEQGVPLAAAIDVAAVLKRHARAVARAYVELFNEHVWEPFEAAGEPKTDWPKVREALDRLQPLAGDSLLAVFNVVMAEAVEDALTESLAAMRES